MVVRDLRKEILKLVCIRFPQRERSPSESTGVRLRSQLQRQSCGLRELEFDLHLGVRALRSRSRPSAPGVHPAKSR